METEINSLRKEIQNLKEQMNIKIGLLEQKIKDLSKGNDEKEKSKNLLSKKREKEKEIISNKNCLI